MTAKHEKDKEFILHIINEIAKYANENDMEVDDTLNSIADWIKGMLQIATFNDLQGDWE